MINDIKSEANLIKVHTEGVTLICKCGKSIDISVINEVSTIKRKNFNIFKCDACNSVINIRISKEIGELEFTFLSLGEDYKNSEEKKHR